MSVASEASTTVYPAPSEEIFRKFVEFNNLLKSVVQHLERTVDRHLSLAEPLPTSQSEVLSLRSLFERIVSNFGEFGSLLKTCIEHLKAAIELCSEESRRSHLGNSDGVVVSGSETNTNLDNQQIYRNTVENVDSSEDPSLNQLNFSPQSPLYTSVPENNIDPYDNLGQCFANQLRNMSTDQVEIAQKLINKILTEGQLGRLTLQFEKSYLNAESNVQ